MQPFAGPRPSGASVHGAASNMFADSILPWRTRCSLARHMPQCLLSAGVCSAPTGSAGTLRAQAPEAARMQPFAGLLPTEVSAPGAPVAAVTPAAAAATGLSENCLVCAGTTGMASHLSDRS